MRVEIKLEEPKEGDPPKKATISFWYKEVNEKVDEGEELVDIITDKAAVTLMSPARGRLVEIAADEDEDVSIGQVLGVIETE